MPTSVMKLINRRENLDAQFLMGRLRERERDRKERKRGKETRGREQLKKYPIIHMFFLTS